MQWTEPRDQYDIILTALGQGEELQDVEVITLKQHFLDVVYEKAIDSISVSNPNALNDYSTGSKKITLAVERIINSGTVFVTEFIKRSPNKITICVDADAIDANTILDITLEHLNRSVDGGSFVKLSKPITFTTADLNERRPQTLSKNNTTTIT